MRIAFFIDYPEENFTSMLVYWDNLYKNLLSAQGKTDKLIIKKILPLGRLSQKLGYKNLKTRFLFRYFICPILAIFKQGDINHIADQTYGHLLYLLNPKKTIITVHDLDVLRLKQIKWDGLRNKIIKLFYLWSIKAIKRAAKVIAVSKDTKKDIIKFLHIPAKKITVIPNGVEPIFKQIKDKSKLLQIKNKYHLPNKFILHVGECWEYKNIDGLIKAFAKLAKLKRFRDIYFVKVNGKWTKKQKELIKKSKISNKIKKLGFIKRGDLPAIYNMAQCLVQPSFLEGFGLTVLEAMACACPVIVSDTQALKELVKNSGIIINPNNVDEIVDAIKKIVNERNYCKKLRDHGLKRAKLYSWEKTTNCVLKVYWEVYESKFR